MKLEQYRCLWGVFDVDGDDSGTLARSPFQTFDQAIPEIARLGFDGVELPFKMILHIGKEHFKTMLKKHNLKCTITIFSDGVVVPGSGILWGGPYAGFTAPTLPGETDKAKLVATHLKVWQEQVEAAQEFSPTLVNSHTLKDFFTFKMAEEFFTQALAWEEQKGYTVTHETHRKRFLHSPWVARDFVPKFPKMKICADLSHWIDIAETNTTDPDLTQVIEDIAPQVWHTHCRVGYDHGPQVADPRAPEWVPYMEGHERWWDAIWKAQAAHGQRVSTMIAEHGPPNYQQTLPHSREPVAHIWDVNHWIHQRRQIRWQELFGSAGISKIIPSKTQGPLPETRPGDSILQGKGRNGFLGDDEQMCASSKRPRTTD
jgi:sugar phosphate isomerase/epimerase